MPKKPPMRAQGDGPVQLAEIPAGCAAPSAAKESATVAAAAVALRGAADSTTPSMLTAVKFVGAPPDAAEEEEEEAAEEDAFEAIEGASKGTEAAEAESTFLTLFMVGGTILSSNSGSNSYARDKIFATCVLLG